MRKNEENESKIEYLAEYCKKLEQIAIGKHDNLHINRNVEIQSEIQEDIDKVEPLQVKMNPENTDRQ